jgi:hypothetical protein
VMLAANTTYLPASLVLGAHESMDGGDEGIEPPTSSM